MFLIMFTYLNLLLCSYRINPVYLQTCGLSYQAPQQILRIPVVFNLVPIYTNIHFIPPNPFPGHQNNLQPSLPLTISQGLPTPNSKTDYNTLIKMLNPVKENISFLSIDFNFKKQHGTKKIKTYTNIYEFIEKMRGLITRKRNNLGVLNYPISIEDVVDKICNVLQYDQKQSGLFLIFYNFVYRGMCTHTNSMTFKNDYLVIGREEEFKLNYFLLEADLLKWKRLNFSFETLGEAWDILNALGSGLRDFCLDSTVEYYSKAFKNSIWDDIIYIWHE